MKKACVIGWPIGHSRSPLIHNYWLRRHGIAGAYDKVEVEPASLSQFIAGLGGEFTGCNVTVPHKEGALSFLAGRVDRTARAVRAVNTIWMADGLPHGGNTDVEGFLANLDHGAPGWDRAPLDAVVLGAGGAARAVVYGLVTRKAGRIAIVNRSRERAEELARDFGATVSVFGYDDLPDLLPSATLVVNATSLGMQGGIRLRLRLDGLRRDAVVTDLVYVPLQTDLLKDAAARGNRTVDGLGMLLHQAVPGFEKWFGVRPEVTPELRALVEADIGSGA